MSVIFEYYQLRTVFIHSVSSLKLFAKMSVSPARGTYLQMRNMHLYQSGQYVTQQANGNNL